MSLLSDNNLRLMRRALVIGSVLAIIVFAALGQLRPAVVLAGSLALAVTVLCVARMLTMLFARSEPHEEPPTDERRRELIMEKNFLLAAIRELEFDRAMGKISEKDHQEGLRVARDRALEVMRELDATTAVRTLLERELAERLAARKIPAAKTRAKAPKSEDGAARAATSCHACRAPVARDARFCPQCGAPLSKERVV